jgi:crotonobetainyl-CoA:carnitine CoA-transferase CaiB-like acyl-CoA transferase
MEGPLAGVRVLEVANWLAAPSGCALLADFGAQVVKVEPPGGDPLRGYLAQASGFPSPLNYPFELCNRGKRGITLNLAHPRAREVLYDLVKQTDVFVTNLLPGRRERYGVTYEELLPHRRDLIYVSVTGYGSTGPDRDRLGYDYAAFWARSGIMGLLGEPDDPPPPQRPAMGDHTTALLVAGSVAMALLHRQQSGQGQEVDVSLHNTGLWVLAADIQGALVGAQAPRLSRRSVPNPLWNSYRTGDGRWIMLVMLVSDMYWPQLCRAVAKEDLENDPRFDTFASRLQNREELIGILDGVFAQRTLDGWAPSLDEHGIIWAPAQTISEVLNDPQTRARRPFATISHPVAGEIELVDTPVKFGKAKVGARGPAPELGQHTEEVLLESGYTWDDITRVREEGVI